MSEHSAVTQPFPLLWVEDDLALSAWLADSLADDGWQVLVAHDRPQALQSIEAAVPKNQACVAILDMGLPPSPSLPEEGLKLLAHLVREWPLLKAIVLTGQHEQAVGQQAVRQGAFDFLAKPVSLQTLRNALQRASWFAQRDQELLAQGCLHLSLSAQLNEGPREVGDGVAEQLIRHVLNLCGFNVTVAARTLGLEREQLYYHMKKFGIQRPPGAADATADAPGKPA
ncbi:MAG: response regulator [Hydrogenophaga sp.]|uniref:response regulator n=1 Tax=Hydrogenophaga sp. TaxID=1904254 RepID=UPI002757C373|nr:response regulator [Hydrogenophaga sp.]MDP2416619.1 response regulator [Hydrogenophaga sp.]MDZ4188496.1 response regulator [Hydrogenophaga sp.]